MVEQDKALGIRQVGRRMAYKLMRMISLLLALSVLSFILVSHSPVDPVQAYIGADMMKVSTEQRLEIENHWGLNKPPVERFAKWASALLQGDMGMSMIYRSPVTEVIKERFVASLILMALAWMLSGIAGFGLGLLAGMNRGTPIDKAIRWYSLTMASAPTFWVGLLMIMVFSVGLGWFPVGLGVPAGVIASEVTLGQKIHHLILPALTLSIVGIAPIALHTREKLLDVLGSAYILYARARGMSGSALLWKQCLRNVLLPAITLQFASLSELFGGSVLAEQVFSYPGLGQATVQAGIRGDLPLLLGIVIFSAVFIFTGNLIADLLYLVIDPRMREGRQLA